VVALVVYTSTSLLFPAKETFLDEDEFSDGGSQVIHELEEKMKMP
jgi:hypothetical protein